MNTNTTLQLLEESPYQSYVYAYPHKTAYRPFSSPLPLSDVWASEDKSALFLYIHIPFCEMRCGFCNLFTTVHPNTSLESAYLQILESQAKHTQAAIGKSEYARLAIGGGTPTYLEPSELEHIFDIAENIMEVNLSNTPTSVETSPLTATTDRLTVLRERHVDRISIGVQSFIEDEVRSSGRAQRTTDVHIALQNIRKVGFPTLNIDLIYGLPDQTVESWLFSLEAALEYQPEELYLYPLYVRPLTGLDKHHQNPTDNRLACYLAARELLQERGYHQVSMRMFRAADLPYSEGPLYCCQEDGMVGLGCGARSYTRHFHYSTDYAVGRQGILEILKAYINRTPESFDVIDYGFELNLDDQRRRYLLKSLLHSTGLSLTAYKGYFGTEAFTDFPELDEMIRADLIDLSENHLTITDHGLTYSDAIGSRFYSDVVRELMGEFDLR